MTPSGIDIAVKLIEAQQMLRRLRAFRMNHYNVEATDAQYKENGAGSADPEHSSHYEGNIQLITDEMAQFTDKSFELAGLLESISDKKLGVPDGAPRTAEPTELVYKAQKVLEKIEAAILELAAATTHNQQGVVHD